MLDRILQFIRERLDALNTAINNLNNKSNSLSSSINTLSSNHSTLSNKVDSNTQSIAQLKEDTAWVKLTKSTNWDGTNDYCVYRKVGQFVEIRFTITPKATYSAGGNPLLIANGLPVEAQPTVWTAKSVAYHNGNAYRFDIGVANSENAGELRLYRTARDVTKGTLVTGHIMYIAKQV